MRSRPQVGGVWLVSMLHGLVLLDADDRRVGGQPLGGRLGQT